MTTLKPDKTPTAQPVRVTIVLTEPPTTRFYAALHAEAVYSAADLTRAVAAQLARIHRQQDDIIRVVTAPPFSATVVLRMQSALNAVVVTLEAESCQSCGLCQRCEVCTAMNHWVMNHRPYLHRA